MGGYGYNFGAINPLQPVPPGERALRPAPNSGSSFLDQISPEVGSPIDQYSSLLQRQYGTLADLLNPANAYRVGSQFGNWLTTAPKQPGAPPAPPKAPAPPRVVGAGTGEQEGATEDTAEGGKEEGGQGGLDFSSAVKPTMTHPTAAEAELPPIAERRYFNNSDLERMHSQGPERGGFGTFETPETMNEAMLQRLIDQAGGAASARLKAMQEDPTGEKALAARERAKQEYAKGFERDMSAKREAAGARYNERMQKIQIAKQAGKLTPDAAAEAEAEAERLYNIDLKSTGNPSYRVE